MIYVPSKKIRKTVVEQRDLTTIDPMNKSALDRSSRSVIDEYVTKFQLSEMNLQKIKSFLEELENYVDTSRETLEKQRVTLIDQCGDDTPATEKGREQLERVKEVLDDAEEDLEDLKGDIEDKLKCLEACYGGGQGEQACTSNCEINCQGACLSACQDACQATCQNTCEFEVQNCDNCESVCQSVI